MLDNLSQEILRNSPTFRNQVTNAFTAVAINRWKNAKTIAVGVDALAQAGAATTDDLIARTYAQTEMAFLEQALAKQRIYFGQYQQQNIAGPNMDMAADSITKLIDQMIGSPGSTWSWSVADWQANQETAIEEIATQTNLLALNAAIEAARPVPASTTAGSRWSPMKSVSFSERWLPRL